MRVLLLPSWWPGEGHPHAGVFCRDQALACAEIFPQHDWHVALWGQDTLAIDPRRPLSSARAIWTRLHSRATTESLRDNLTLHRVPTLHGGRRMQGDQRIARSLSTLVDRLRPDILHAHVCFPAGAIARRLADARNVPYILTEHMLPFPFPHLMVDGRPAPEVLYGLDGAARIICVGQQLETLITAIDPGVQRPIVVIPNVVDEREFRPAAERRPGAFTFLLVGHLIPWKNPLAVIDALGGLIRNKRNARLEIIGNGELESAARARVTALGLDDHVTFHGVIDDRATLADRYRTGDAVVLASRGESFGVVVIEGLASGLPVVSTRCGGPEATIGPDDGILVPVGDPRALESGMAEIMDRTWDAVGIRQRALARFSRSVFASAVVDVYTHVLSGAGHPIAGPPAIVEPRAFVMRSSSKR